MPKLKVVDYDDFVLEGEFEKIIPIHNTFLDEENVLSAVQKFKDEFVDKGLALGTLNDGFLVMPVDVEIFGYQLQADQVCEENKDPSFMIIDIYWERDLKAICGRLIILDTEDGLKIKDAIKRGVECFISASDTDVYTTMDKEDGRIYTKMSNINGYKISLIDFYQKQ